MFAISRIFRSDEVKHHKQTNGFKDPAFDDVFSVEKPRLIFRSTTTLLTNLTKDNYEHYNFYRYLCMVIVDTKQAKCEVVYPKGQSSKQRSTNQIIEAT